MNHERKLSCVRFPKTAAQRFPAQAGQLNAAFDARLRRRALLAEHARDSKEKQWHLKRQILPGIAAYEMLQTVLPKDEAPHHNIGPRRRPLRLLPENSEITAGGISTWRSNNLAIHRESV